MSGCKCAGVSGSFKSFLEAEPEDLEAVTRTNLLGALLCTRAAAAAMARQDRGGHVFNMDGAGADGGATPMYAAYGATKAGIAHVMGSVAAEVAASGAHVGVHTLSPGMVLTELILDGATTKNKQVCSALCPLVRCSCSEDTCDVLAGRLHECLPRCRPGTFHQERGCHVARLVVGLR